jgi:hypothetical protein
MIESPTAGPGRVRRWARRAWRTTVGPFALMLALAAVMLSPLSFYEMPASPGHDLACHVSAIVEAKNALDEHQFPVRVAPRQNDRGRYPLFQFYGNLPYTAGGLIYRYAGLDPYAALKQVLWLGLALAGFFVYRSARLLTRRALPSLVAGAVFVAAPYLLTDVHARFAFPETVSFCLLPVAFYFAARCFQSRRLRFIPCGALAWSALGLSHNITFLYGSVFFAAWFLTFARPRRSFARRLGRVGVAYALGLLLNAWYVVPQFTALPSLVISHMYWSVQECSWLTPLGALLAPGPVPPAASPVPLEDARFSLQVGWAILVPAALAVYYACGGRALSPRQRGPLVRLLLFGGAALFLVWSPFDFWSYLPRVFSFVQFSYRLLMFVVLWGALLAACVLARAWPNGLRPGPFVACLCAPCLLAAPYLSAHHSTDQVSVPGEVRCPNVGRNGADDIYLPTADGPAGAGPSSPADEGAPPVVPVEQARAAAVFGKTTVVRYRASSPCLIQLPVLFYPGLLRVRDNGTTVPAERLGRWLALRLEPGDHVIAVQFVGCRWANFLSAGAWALVLSALFLTGLLPGAAAGEAVRRCGVFPGLPGAVHAAGMLALGGAALVGAAGLLRATVFAPPLITEVVASSTLSPMHEAAYAVDGRGQTAWASLDSDRAVLQLRLRRAVSLRSLDLLARGTNIYEGWQAVTVRLYRGGEVVLEKSFSFPDAATERLEVARFPPTRTDHIELLLSDPVTQTPYGQPANHVLHPGYAEITLGHD